MSRISFEVVGDIERTVAIPLNLVYEQNRYANGELRDRIDMAIEAMAYFESQYSVSNKKITAVSRDQKIIQAEMKLELMKSKNWINVPEMFPFSRYPKEHELPDMVHEIPYFFRQEDYNYLNRVMCAYYPITWFEKFVWKISYDHSVPGISWTDYNPVPLTALCCRSLSMYNRMFTGDKLGKYTTSSCENLYPVKLVKLVEKYNTDTRYVPNMSPVLSKCISRGLLRLYDFMGVKKHFGKIMWTITERDVYMFTTPTQSSAGIRAGGEKPYTDQDGIKVKMTVNGTKGDQEKTMKIAFWKHIEEIRDTGKTKFTEKASCICQKFEIFNCYSLDPLERQKMYEKCRDFFILQQMMYYIAQSVQKDRQLIERGKCIKIGMKFFFGGAQKFAEQMKYDDPTMKFFDGDFKALDTTINRVLLELYSSQAAVYVSKQSPHYAIFMYLLQVATENLSVKAVHIFARIWKIIFGTMPSGAYETSHGNSWIVALLWFSYTIYVEIMTPHKSALIEEVYQSGRMQFPVYGDDHVSAIGSEISDIINEEGFAKFVNIFFKMEIRNIRSNIPFLSVPDEHGGLKVRGVVFLKRYFIARTAEFPEWMPKVLPYKHIDDFLVKLAWGNNPRLTLADYAIASIGLAYDSMGTNHRIHELCLHMFQFCVSAGKFSSMDSLVASFYRFGGMEKKEITRISRKAGIPIETVLNGFPTLNQLYEMHRPDKTRVNFTPDFGRYNPENVKHWEM